MPLVPMDLSSLDKLDDGRVAKAFLHDLNRIVQDCYDRPGDKKPRSIVLEFAVVPVASTENGQLECESVEGQFRVKSKVPERRSKTYSFKGNTKGHLAFSVDSPDNVNQTTMFPAAEEEE
jgi:hypothetical protein